MGTWRRLNGMKAGREMKGRSVGFIVLVKCLFVFGEFVGKVVREGGSGEE